MFVVYSFAAVFMAQILAMSVLLPSWLDRSGRAQLRKYPSERFPQLYPQGVAGVERSFSRYQLLNAGIAVLGLVLLGGLFKYMLQPDWDDGPVEALVTTYFVLQALPLVFWGVAAFRMNKLIRASLTEERRTATLKRRGLFDFVSPVTVVVAVLAYFFYAGFVLYIEQHPFSGFAGALVNIAGVTVIYVGMALGTWFALYGTKPNPLVTQSERMQSMGFVVKVYVYTCILTVLAISLNFSLVLLDLQRWEPVAQSLFLVAGAISYAVGLKALPRRSEAGDLSSSNAF